MSRKHPPIPDSDRLTISKAIARRRNELLAAGRRPEALVLGPDLWPVYGDLWAAGDPWLLGMRLERDPAAEGWAIRCREPG